MSTKPRMPNFKAGEDQYVCSIYLDVTQGPIVGNNQTSDRFWHRVEKKPPQLYFFQHDVKIDLLFGCGRQLSLV